MIVLTKAMAAVASAIASDRAHTLVDMKANPTDPALRAEHAQVLRTADHIANALEQAFPGDFDRRWFMSMCGYGEQHREGAKHG